MAVGRSIAVNLLFSTAPIFYLCFFCVWSLFCYAVPDVLSKFVIILPMNRARVSLL